MGVDWHHDCASLEPAGDWASRGDGELMTVLADPAAPRSWLQAACAELVSRWYDPLLRYVDRLFEINQPRQFVYSAEDVVQEAFALVIEKAGQFDPGRPLLPWLRQVVRNLAVNLWRRENRYRSLGPCGQTLAARPEVSAVDQLALQEVLAGLAPAEKHLFETVLLGKQRVDEAARGLGWPPGRAYQVLRELRAQLGAGPPT
jgi:RNA polymerase sigma-70 factor (ECF subfamily)